MEKSNSVAQKLELVKRLIDSRPALFRRQGAVVAMHRTCRGRTLGPYFKLCYRAHGRQRSIYLGRSQRLADAARALLEECQRPEKLRRQLRRLRRSGRARLRAHCRVWNRQLRQVGLHLHGLEVRGWRRPAANDSLRQLNRGETHAGDRHDN